ncbi:MAG: nucleoside diphosphate kinase regulator [Rhodospirillales bacterium]|nr:nucleoside diphosphate kinase regulator [Rhodospirillales bacterium]
MERKTRTTEKPKIVVRQSDYDRLQGLASAAQSSSPEVAEELVDELDRAGIVEDAGIGADVVRMGSTVEYRSDVEGGRTVTLVFPGEADIAQGRVSILTPIGAALLGLSPGQSIGWTARDGRRHRLTIVSVHQETPASAA